MLPSFVTCPISTKIELLFLAAIISSCAQALTCVTVPGELSIWGKYIV